MVHLRAIMACIALVSVSVECLKDETHSNITVTVVESLDEYLRENPNVKVLQKLEKKVEYASSYTQVGVTHFSYTVGQRAKGNDKFQRDEQKLIHFRTLGDYVVAYGNGGQPFNEPRDITQILSYPASGGTGAAISHVYIGVLQVNI